MIEEIKSCQSEVKESKSDKRLEVTAIQRFAYFLSLMVYMGLSLTLTIERAGPYSLPCRCLLEKCLTTLHKHDIVFKVYINFLRIEHKMNNYSKVLSYSQQVVKKAISDEPLRGTFFIFFLYSFQCVIKTGTRFQC